MNTINVKVLYGKRKEKDFEICIVPNKFNVDYAKYHVKQRKVIKLNEELQAAKTVGEVQEVESKLKELGLEHILEEKYNLVKTIMIANEYEFDRDWWDSKADAGSIEHMIAQCVMKDADTVSKKKELLRQMGFSTTAD
jgi:hypothetical protein